MPGDASSAARFVRAAFLKWNSVSPQDEKSNVSQFFHILDGVSMVRGSVITEAEHMISPLIPAVLIHGQVHIITKHTMTAGSGK